VGSAARPDGADPHACTSAHPTREERGHPGVGALWATAAGRGTRLMLSRPGPIVRMVLEMARLDEILVRATTEA
jgi:hypothetical protein